MHVQVWWCRYQHKDMLVVSLEPETYFPEFSAAEHFLLILGIFSADAI